MQDDQIVELYRQRDEAAIKETAQKYGSNVPFFVGEFWGGRSMHWGEPFYHRDPQEVAVAYREALEANGNVCFYMFAGGTNFGFIDVW